MASNDTLYMTLELKSKMNEELQQLTKQTEKLNQLLTQAGIDTKKLDFGANIRKNLQEAEKMLFKLLDVQEKLNTSIGKGTDRGFDVSQLQNASKRIDDIVNSLTNIKHEALLSKTAVKDLAASLNAVEAMKIGRDLVTSMNKDVRGYDSDRKKQEKQDMRDIERMEKARIAAEKEAEQAALRNASAQERVKDALSKIATARANLSAASEKGNQQEVAHAQLLMSLLDRLSNKLNVLKNAYLGEKGVLDGVLGSGYKGLLRNVTAAINDIGKVGTSATQSPVSLISDQNVSDTLRRIDAIGAAYTRLQKLLTEMGDWGKSPRNAMEMALGGTYNKYSGNYEQQIGVFRDTLARIRKEIDEMSKAGMNVVEPKKQLDALYETFAKLEALKPVNLGEKLGLEHLRGYTGPQSALSDEAWRSAKREAEVREVAIAVAERHKQKLAELTEAFERQEKAEAKERQAQEQAAKAQERATARQQSYYQNQQKASQVTRQRAEELVRLRMELLKTQAAELQGLLRNGKGTFSATQFQDVQNALRSVREEMRQIETVMQRMNSYSTRDLINFGRGTQNWSPLIANAQQILNAQKSIRQLSEEEEKLIHSIDKANSAFHNQNRILSDLQNGVSNYLSLWGARDFLNNIIQIGGQLEMQRLSIGAILGDTAQANDLFEKIKSLAVQSPFGVVELDQYTKQLSAYGFKYNELYDMTKRLADISAGAGTDVGRLALALGHVRSEAALSGYTLRQFAMNNIPMVGELAKMLTEVEGKLVSVSEVRKRVKNKEIGYDAVESVIRRLTDEGGMFFNMQEVVSQSVKARWKNLKDSLDIMYGEMAEASVGGALKETAVILTNVSRHWKELFAVLKSGMIVLGAYKAVMLTNTLLMGKESAAVSAGVTAKTKADKANLRLASSYRTLTAEEQRFTGVSGKALMMADALAISEKKLTAEALARQVALGKLSKAQAMQVLAMAKMSTQERAYARTIVSNVREYGRFTGVINGLAISFRSLGLAMKSILFNPMTAIFAAVGIATELWQKNNEEVERAKELNDSLFNRATEGIKNIKQMMEETDMSFVLNGKETDFGELDKVKAGGQFVFKPADDMSTAEMVSAIEKWTQFIKEYSPSKNNVLNNAFADESGKVRDLAVQYQLLGEAVSRTAEAYVWLKQVSGAAQFGEDLSNAGVFSDSLITNIDDYAQDVKNYNDAVSKAVYENRQWWTAALKAARGSKEFSKALKENGISTENLSEQIKLILSNVDKYSSAIAEMEKKGFSTEWTKDREGVFGWNNTLRDYRTDMSESFFDMYDDIDKWADGVKQRLSEMGWDIKNLTDSQKDAIALAIAETVAKTKKGTDAIRKEVEGLMYKKFNIKIDADTVKAAAKIAGLKQSLHDLVYGPNGEQEWTIDIKTATDFGDVISNIRKSYKEAKEYFENAKPLAIKMGIDVSGGLKNIGVVKRTAIVKKWQQENPGKDSSMIEDFLLQWDKMADYMSDAMGFSKNTGISLDDPNKKKNTGSKADAQLKKLQERKKALDEYYKLYQEYSKYMKREEAIALINKTGLIKGQALPKNIDDYLQVLKDFQAGISKGSINTTERQSFWDSLKADISKKDFEQGPKKTADALLKQLDEELKTRGKQWNLYKKVLEATGDRSQAAQMAFGGDIRFDNYAQELRDRLNRKLEDLPKAKAVGIDKLLGMDEESLAGLGIFEKSDIVPMLKELKDVEQQLNDEDVNLFLDAVKNAKSLEEELNRIAVKYDRARKAIKENGNLTPERKQELTENLNNEKARANADKRWEYFKKNEEWGRVFTNLDKMSTQTLRNMRDELVRTLPDISDSVEATKALYEALEKIDKVANQRNPFKTLSDAVRKYNAIGALIGKGGMSSLGFRNENGTYTVGTNNLGVKPGTYTRAQLKDIQKASGTEFNEGMQSLSSKFKMLQDSLNPVIDLFNALGQTKAAEFLQAGSNALGAASQMSTGAVAAFGASAGPWGAAVGAALSLTTSFLSMQDKAIQKEIEASKARQKEMEMLSKNMEKVLERVLGGVYNYRNSEESIRQTTRFSEEVRRYIDMDKRAKKAQEELTELEKRSGGKNIAVLSDSYRMTKWRLERDIKNSYVKADTLQAIDHAEKTLEYYDQQRASLMIQRDEAEHQLAQVEERKGDHKQEIDDYRQQITELDDQLVHFALDMAKALYDIDIKSWAQQLTDAVVSAWDSGADAAEAYSKKVKSLVKDLTKNILAQRVVEQMFDNSDINKLIAGMMDTESGILNMRNVEAIADVLFKIGENASNAITAVLDEEERRGYIERGEGSSSSKLIQGGFTENETGLLLSYVNAIRGDLSVQRTDVNAIRLSVEMMAGRQGIIAEAQTRHLEQIAANTMRNADAAEAIQSLLRRATQDKSFGFHIQ